MSGTRFLTLVLLLLQAGGPPRGDVVERLRARVPVTPVTASSGKVPGRYTSTSKELAKRVGTFLSGEDLYLFPDGTYIYCEWADIEPVTVSDKGRWKLSGSALELVSDGDIRWTPSAQRKYVAVRRNNRADEVILVGLDRDLPYIEREAGHDPELMLLIVGLVRTEAYDRAKAAKVKAQILREAWRPEYFRNSR
jgi:hypothetical protein